MKSAAVSKVKAAFSEYLARVKAGEEIVVTERGRPIATIVPIRRDASSDAAHLMELARTGLVRIGSGKLPRGFWKMPRPKDATGSARKALLEERAEGR